MTLQHEEIISAANFYIEHGWYVVPVKGKRPLGEKWHERAALNTDHFINDFDGVGVLLGEKSNLIDFDCDSDESELTLQKLFGGTIPPTWTFKSARGKHRLFKWDNRLDFGVIKIVIDGLEIRTGCGPRGAQSVFPPSGGREWITCDELAEVPEPVIERIRERYAEIHKPKQIKKQNFVTSDIGNSELLNVPKWLAKHGHEIIGRTDSTDGTTRYHIACPRIDQHTTANSWKDCCVTQDASGRLGGCCFHSSCGMSNWNDLRNAIGQLEWSDFNEPLDETGVDISAVVSQITNQELPKQEQPAEPESNQFPEEILNPGGILERMIEHNANTAIYPMPELALAGAISLMSVITGRKVQDLKYLRTNTYVIGLAPSGSGKNDARNANRSILYRLGFSGLLAPTKIKSSSGIISALVKQNPSLFQWDEMAKVLRTMRDPDRNPHMADVISVLLEAWGESSNECWEPGAYADSSKNPIITEPHLSFYGTSTPSQFWESLTRQNMTDGLVGRLLVFERDKYPDDHDGGDVKDFSEILLAEVESWLKFGELRSGSTKVDTTAVRIDHTDDALERYIEHRKQINSRKGESEIRAALWRRANEKAGKLALICACSRCPPICGRPLTIELSDVNWGIKAANWLTRSMICRSRFKTSESNHETNLNRILGLLTTWTRLETIGQKIRSIRADERNKILVSAVADGLIESREVSTGTKIAREFRTVVACGD